MHTWQKVIVPRRGLLRGSDRIITRTPVCAPVAWADGGDGADVGWCQ